MAVVTTNSAPNYFQSTDFSSETVTKLDKTLSFKEPKSLFPCPQDRISGLD